MTIERISDTPAAGPSGPSPDALCCPSCGSSFVHPLAWTAGPGGRARLRLRCGECRDVTWGDYGQAEVAAYDRALDAGRLELTALYHAMVRANMSAEMHKLRVALALDLVSADDFAGYNR